MNEMDRRDFLKQAGVTSTVLILGFEAPISGRKAWAAGEGKGFTHHYVMIGAESGDFTFVMDKAEMGQGVITGQLTLFCEEFDVNPNQIKVVAAPVADVYGTMAGMQLTGGSTSTNDRWTVLRQAGANARGILLAAAAKKYSVPVGQLKTDNGFIVKPDGDRVSYNEIAKDVTETKIEDQKLKSPSDFKYIGKNNVRSDASEKSLGEAQYGMDFDQPGLLQAVVLRSPMIGGKLKSFDAAEAKKLPGIKSIVEISSGLAIVGEKYWQVSKARDFVKVEWEAPKDLPSSESIKAKYQQLLKSDKGKEVHSEGNVTNVFAESGAESIVEAEYELPYLSHSCMEPMNAAAHVQKDRADIWVSTQGPTLVRNEAADFLGLSRDQVTVHCIKYLGGGFGRRSTLDYPMEAVELSQKLKSPVKVVWSREDDTKHSPMRPLSLHHLKGVVKSGKPVAWEHRLACESIMQQVMPGWVPLMMPGWLPGFVKSGVEGTARSVMDWTSTHIVTAEGAKHDYEIPNIKVRVNEADLNVPIHFWRSVGHSYNGFVVESFTDELAHKANKDPVEFRREILQKNPRGLAVLNKVASLSGWGDPLPEGRFRGVAYHFSFNSYVAEVAEVEVKDSQILVKKVFCAVDCGTVINPEIVKDQMQSGIIFGLSAALHGEITLENGSVQQGNFDDYPVMRMSEVPEIEVAIVESTEIPTGVGEPGLPPIAAAVANAVFAATGQRLRKLPLKL